MASVGTLIHMLLTFSSIASSKCCRNRYNLKVIGQATQVTCKMLRFWLGVSVSRSRVHSLKQGYDLIVLFLYDFVRQIVIISIEERSKLFLASLYPKMNAVKL